MQDAVGAVFPSAQLVVVDRFRVVLQRAVGACTDDTPFDIASLTKPLATVTLTMQALEARKLTLEDPVRPGVTIRHLLTHSSGLPAWKKLAPGEDLRVMPLAYPTGTKSVYSDLGFILLGDVLEAANGNMSLTELFDDCVAERVGIETSYEHDRAAEAAPCEGLRGVVHDDNARAMGGAAGHAGLFSTARDVATLTTELMRCASGQPGLVRPETVRQFWTGAGVPGSTWCLGWDRPSATGSQAGGRWPRDGVGHLGFTGCSVWVDLPRGRTVALLSNRVEPTRANERIKLFRPELHDAIVAALDG